ncbi:MAG TPA: hypothetical protein VHM25_15095 [Polyangiaceae bacterium]|nr:hypothetical protein [Polyangiaceae bacterium]
MKPILIPASCLGLVACAAPQTAPPIERAPHSANVAATPSASAQPQFARTAAPAPSAAPAQPTPLELTVTRLLSVPVDAIALGEGTRIAVLADTPYVGDARGLRSLPLPAALRPQASESDELGIFFGRDNEPRIMGTRRGQKGERAVYLRHLPNGWRDGREEIGALGGAAAGGLWGVLGSADPELVCRVGAVCIIKRNSGWTTAPAGALKRLVTLQDGVLWGLESGGISGIDAHGWTLAIPAPSWTEPRAFWATRGEAWVSTPAELFHYRDGKWATVSSPVGAAASFWGTRPDSVWVVGATGAAHFDGQGFRTVAIAGPLRVVRGRSDAELWFGGDAGLFRASSPAKDAH